MVLVDFVVGFYWCLVDVLDSSCAYDLRLWPFVTSCAWCCVGSVVSGLGLVLFICFGLVVC